MAGHAGWTGGEPGRLPAARSTRSSDLFPALRPPPCRSPIPSSAARPRPATAAQGAPCATRARPPVLRLGRDQTYPVADDPQDESSPGEEDMHPQHTHEKVQRQQQHLQHRQHQHRWQQRQRRRQQQRRLRSSTAEDLHVVTFSTTLPAAVPSPSTSPAQADEPPSSRRRAQGRRRGGHPARLRWPLLSGARVRRADAHVVPRPHAVERQTSASHPAAPHVTTGIGPRYGSAIQTTKSVIRSPAALCSCPLVTTFPLMTPPSIRERVVTQGDLLPHGGGWLRAAESREVSGSGAIELWQLLLLPPFILLPPSPLFACEEDDECCLQAAICLGGLCLETANGG